MFPIQSCNAGQLFEAVPESFIVIVHCSCAERGLHKKQNIKKNVVIEAFIVFFFARAEVY